MAKGKFAQKLLDMAHSSRMGRAREMGMMTKMPLYHGTNKDVTEFSLERGGEVSRSPVGKLGVSLSTDPETASEFASLAGDEGANVIQAYHRASKPVRIDLEGNETNLEVASAVQDAWEQGFDAIMFNNYTTPGGKAGKKFILVKDPSQIRSVNAKFDPSNKESSNLLASMGGVSVGLGGVLSDDAQALESDIDRADKLEQLANLAAQEGDEETELRALEEMKKMLGNIPNNLAKSYVEQADQRGDVGSIEGVKSEMLGKAADFAGEYNKFRKEKLVPIADMILPVGELPEEVLRKMSYEDKITYVDAVKATLGLL